MPQVGYSHRPVALGRRGMVAAAHSYAALAGLDVLKAGGTAADAAVATNAVLGVTEPQDCGVGGDFFCLYYEAATGRVHFLNGSGRSGSRAGLDELRRRGMEDRKSTRLNSSHGYISYAVFCLKKKKQYDSMRWQ